jgi:hypothetical protein
VHEEKTSVRHLGRAILYRARGTSVWACAGLPPSPTSARRVPWVSLVALSVHLDTVIVLFIINCIAGIQGKLKV